MSLVPKLLASLGALGAAGACCYYACGLWAAFQFDRFRQRTHSSQPAFTPPVSILKPLHGIDPGMWEALRSHCVQNYPEYEIIFGVGSDDDPAIPLIKCLQSEFPQLAMRTIVCPQVLGMNRKVSNLAQMLPHARYDHIFINDADIEVPPDYLQTVVQPLAEDAVGMVTCLYRGIPAATLGSRLEALGIVTDFACGVLIARELEGVRFGLGATLALTRRALQAIGGFAPLLEYLADDFELGNRIFHSGKRVYLSETAVASHLPAYSFREFLDHQLRWARTVRDSRRAGYVGLGFTFGLPWALLTLFGSAGAAWAWGLLIATALLRLLLALRFGKLLGERYHAADLALLPLRDVLALGIWLVSFAGNHVAWRGQKYVLEKGRLRPA